MYFTFTIEFGRGQRKRESEQRELTAWSWKRLSEHVKNRDGSVCQYCGAYAPDGGADHVTPLTQGGTDALDNLVWACKECNSSKGDKTPEEWDAPKTAAAPRVVRVEVVSDNGRPATIWGEIRPEYIQRFAQAALDEQLTGAGRHGLSRRKFQQIRDEAMHHGLLVWKVPHSHPQGVEVTPEGKQVFAKLLTELNDGQGQLL